MKKIKDYSLYFVTSEEYSEGKNSLDVARQAIYGGVDIIQMREKNKSHEELISLGKEMSRLCEEKNVTFIVNDDPLLAKEVNAGGVHLGQEDIKKYPIENVREILPNESIIGVSTHSVEQFTEANSKDYDYIAFGPIFYTKTKDYSIGKEDIGQVLELANKPVVFIGGINSGNIKEVLDEGGKNIAIIRAIAASEDITASSKELKSMISAQRGNI